MLIYAKLGKEGRELIRWLYRTDMSRQTYISGISKSLSYRRYEYENGLEPMPPSICLRDDGTFHFSYSLFSSYLCIGKYELADGILTLRTDDGKNTYVFGTTDDGFAFDAAQSSYIPSYKYSGAAAESQCPVPDGAVFEFKGVRSVYDPIYDVAEYDIDKDGEKETLTLSAGPTSGRFTFRFTATEPSGETIENIFPADGWIAFSFEEAEGGEVYLRAKTEGGEDVYYRLGIKDGNITIAEVTEEGIF